MSRVAQVSIMGFLFVLLIVSNSAAQVTQQARGAATGSTSTAPGWSPYPKAFIIDDRLSALRREPKLQSEVIRRIRLAQRVFIVGINKPKGTEPLFYRVAVTRRTRGWIHASAVATPGRRGEDQRLMSLIAQTTDGIDKITLCRIVIERFPQSRFVPSAMLLLGEEAERAADTLSQRTRRRLAEIRGAEASLRDYYLNDAGLDRYSRLGIVFDFDETTGQFAYNGKAYRDILRRFPHVEEAKLARQRLDLGVRKTASQ